jgi:peptidoglycan/LPS O-acetylase OafA/YrhL
MRAWAVLAVVLYHANLAHIHGGFVGVDVFFVISGFLITGLLLESVGTRGLRAMPTFYTRRIRRLLPASVTVVIATVVAARIWAALPLSVRSISLDGIFTTFYGLNYRLAVEGTQYLNQDNTVSPLQHYWSLGVEEQFYFCWPILIVLIAFLGRRNRNLLLTVVLLGVGVASFYYSVTLTKPRSTDDVGGVGAS